MEKLDIPDMDRLKLPNPKNKIVLILMAHMVHIFLHLPMVHMVHIFLHLPMVHMDTQVTDTHLLIHLPIVNMTKKVTDTHLLIHLLLHLPIITDTHLLHIVTDMAMVVIVSHIHIMADMVNMDIHMENPNHPQLNPNQQITVIYETIFFFDFTLQLILKMLNLFSTGPVMQNIITSCIIVAEQIVSTFFIIL